MPPHESQSLLGIGLFAGIIYAIAIIAILIVWLHSKKREKNKNP